MNIKDGNQNPHHNSEGENERNNKANDWRKTICVAFENLHTGSYSQNLIAGFIFLLVTPFIGYLVMKTLQGMMYAFGIGITILFWIIWVAVIWAVPATPDPSGIRSQIGSETDAPTRHDAQSAVINNTNQSGGTNIGIKNE